MKNIALDRPTVLQLDADGTDGALDAAADRDVLRNDAALDLGAIADEKIGGAQLAFDAAVELRRTAAFDVADDRHSGADAGAWPRVRRRVPPRRGLFDDRVLLSQRPLHGFGRMCRGILILLGCFALEHVHLRFPPAFTTERPKLPSRDRARADAEPFTPPAGRTLRLGRHVRIGLCKAESHHDGAYACEPFHVRSRARNFAS